MGRLVVFHLPSAMTASRRVQFNHCLWGRRTTTAGGRYLHERPGLMDEVPHRHLAKGVVIIREADLPQLRSFLQEWDAQTHIRRIELEPDDLAILQEPR